MAKVYRLNLRLDEDTQNELNELCSIYNFDMTKLVITLIHGEYLKVSKHGKKQVHDLIKQLDDMTKAFNSMALNYDKNKK